MKFLMALQITRFIIALVERKETKKDKIERINIQDPATFRLR